MYHTIHLHLFYIYLAKNCVESNMQLRQIIHHMHTAVKATWIEVLPETSG